MKKCPDFFLSGGRNHSQSISVSSNCSSKSPGIQRRCLIGIRLFPVSGSLSHCQKPDTVKKKHEDGQTDAFSCSLVSFYTRLQPNQIKCRGYIATNISRVWPMISPFILSKSKEVNMNKTYLVQKDKVLLRGNGWQPLLTMAVWTASTAVTIFVMFMPQFTLWRSPSPGCACAFAKATTIMQKMQTMLSNNLSHSKWLAQRTEV